MKLIISLLLCTQFILISPFDFEHTNGTAEIHIKVYNNTKHELDCRLVNKEALILKENPFNIYIFSYDAFLYQPSCIINNSTQLSEFKKENGYYVSNNPYIKDINNGSGGSCTINISKCGPIDGATCQYRESNADRIDHYELTCGFLIHYLPLYDYGGAPGGFMTVNKRNIEMTGQQGIHNFYDSSQNVFECRRDSNGYIKLKYISKDGSHESTEYQTKETLSWYMKLTDKDEGGVIECHLASKTMAYVTVLSVQLHNMISDKNELLGFQVNDLALTSEFTPSLPNTTYHYDYKAYQGEPLAVTAVFKKEISPFCYFYRNNNSTKYELLKDKNFYTFNTTFLNYDELVFQCTAKYYHEEYNFALKVSLQNPSDINKMSFSNISSNYTTVDNSYMKITEYVYEYYDNSKLYCASGWIWTNKTEIECQSTEKNTRPNWCTFNFINNYNKSTVKCSSIERFKMNIILVHLFRTEVTSVDPTEKKPKQISYKLDFPNNVGYSTKSYKHLPTKPSQSVTRPIIRPIVRTPNVQVPKLPMYTSTPKIGTNKQLASTESNITPETITVEEFDAGKDDGNPMTPKVIIIVVVVIFVIILITVVVLLRLRHRRKTRSPQLIMDYASLPEHNEGPMPTPTQWTEPNNLYAEPIPKNQRNKNAENDPTYSNVNLTYTNLNLPEQKNKDYSNLSGAKNDRTNYVLVLPSEGDYANCSNDSSNYANMLELNEEPTYLNHCKK